MEFHGGPGGAHGPPSGHRVPMGTYGASPESLGDPSGPMGVHADLQEPGEKFAAAEPPPHADTSGDFCSPFNKKLQL